MDLNHNTSELNCSLENKMIIRNKKGIGMEWYLLIVAFFLGIGAYYIDFYFSPHKITDNYIGQYQFSILKASNKAESSIFYIDQSAKYSLQQALYDLAKDGGLSEVYASEALTPREEPFLPESYVKKCGKFYGYSLWYENDANCFDENKIRLNLELLFNKNLNNYLINYPANIPINNYNYEIRGNIEIIGIAKEPLKFDILKDENKEVIKELVEEKVTTKEGIIGFKDFTGTELCAKGVTYKLTEDAYQKLGDAQKLAKEKGFSIEVYSAYRPEKEQLALWEGRTAEKYRQRFPSEEERRKYVCNPNLGVEECPHMTGKAVDIRFKDKPNSDMTIADWKELEKIMYKAGFRRYTAELWHYECCGTARYNRALALEKETGKEVMATT